MSGPDPAGEETAAAALGRLHAELLRCWNRRDAPGYARLFAAAGSIVGFDGSVVEGAAGIVAHLRSIFADHTPATYVAIVREVRRLGAAVALLRADAGMIPRGGTAVDAGKNAVQSLLAEHDGTAWRIQLFQNTPAAFHGRPQAAAELTAELQRIADAS